MNEKPFFKHIQPIHGGLGGFFLNNGLEDGFYKHVSVSSYMFNILCKSEKYEPAQGRLDKRLANIETYTPTD